ncbi:tyrosine-protein kinase receptor torso-like isoform X2 [Choristoneura fumiferana]|uniref:tyrosine-protein kinase receptor torso-like isoform X2 n=1 Tax=Choristoneura fumiferana TaxID=7141 RepID=UPI003D15C415
MNTHILYKRSYNKVAGTPEAAWLPSELQVTERSNETVMYNVTSSDMLQLVVLVPDKGYAIKNYVWPEDVAGSVNVDDTSHYTFWTAVMAYNGTHSAWREGPRLGPRIPPQQKEYIIRINETYEDSSYVRVNFKWSTRDIDDVLEKDTTYTVANGCFNKKDTEDHIKIKAGKTPSFTIGVSPGDKCTFTVIGPDGSGERQYKVGPQPIEDIAAVASPSNAAWDVRVRWKRPPRDPESYQVVLVHANFTTYVTELGNATLATFHNVTAHGYHRVSLIAKFGKIEAYAAGPTVFIPRKHVEVTPSSVPVLSSLLALMLILTSLLGIVTWYRRRRNQHILHLYQEEDPVDYSKKLFSETTTDSLVSEDGWEVRPEKLLLHEVIGEGAFGVVRRGTLVPSKEVAVKMLKDYPSRDEVRSFRAEMELMKSVGAHPHVVSLVGCCSGRRPLIVAEYCSRGDLLSYLRCSWDVMLSKRNAKYYNNNSQTSNYRNDLFKSKSQEQSKLVVNKLYDLNGICDAELTYVDLLSFCRQIAMGMEFLASNRVVHRDLAARNVLVTSDRTLKIADFGLSRDIYQENQYKQKGNGKMPIKWMALESLTHRIYTTQSDVWSFGVVSWEVVTLGAAPYPDVPPARLPRLLRAGYRMPRPAACCKQLYELMVSCWRARPRERPTFGELHAALDAMLHGACAEQYLALDLDAGAGDDKPDETRGRYTRFMEFARGKRRHGSCCEALRSHNHYSSPPTPPAPAPPPTPPALAPPRFAPPTPNHHL